MQNGSAPLTAVHTDLRTDEQGVTPHLTSQLLAKDRYVYSLLGASASSSMLVNVRVLVDGGRLCSFYYSLSSRSGLILRRAARLAHSSHPHTLNPSPSSSSSPSSGSLHAAPTNDERPFHLSIDGTGTGAGWRPLWRACWLAETNDANDAHRHTHWPSSCLPLRRDGRYYFLTPGPLPTVTSAQPLIPQLASGSDRRAAPANILAILECAAAIAAAPPLPNRHTLELQNPRFHSFSGARPHPAAIDAPFATDSLPTLIERPSAHMACLDKSSVLRCRS
ncbi:hypothetical protein Dda_0877 [Drechslerella dactyloides]|uniref:Uncharacterized protein n=1 Tax=Drechslerella dactyloides TaxID=74499 RepID=A0AAD6NNE4_DREDA|nr:hypothetical protein Dda_0877 [Drechslerella dactyloides]